MRTRAPRRRGGLDRGRARLPAPQMGPRGARGWGGRRAHVRNRRDDPQAAMAFRAVENVDVERAAQKHRPRKPWRHRVEQAAEKARPMADAKGVRREKHDIRRFATIRRDRGRRSDGCRCRPAQIGRASQRRTVAGRGAVPRFVAIPTAASGLGVGLRPLAHGLVACAGPG
jgi:hypothetical protein